MLGIFIVNTIINNYVVPITHYTLKWAFAQKFNSQGAEICVEILVLTITARLSFHLTEHHFPCQYFGNITQKVVGIK